MPPKSSGKKIARLDSPSDCIADNRSIAFVIGHGVMPGLPIGYNIMRMLGSDELVADIQVFMSKSNYIPAVPPGNVCPILSITAKHEKVKTVPSQLAFTSKVMVEAYRLFKESNNTRVSTSALSAFMVDEASKHIEFPRFTEFFGRELDSHVFQKHAFHMGLEDLSVDFSRDDITGLNPCNSMTTICSSKLKNQRAAVHDIGEPLPIFIDISPRGNSSKYCLSRTVDKYEIGVRFRSDQAICELFESLKHKFEYGDVLLSDMILFFYLYNPDADGVDILSMTCTSNPMSSTNTEVDQIEVSELVDHKGRSGKKVGKTDKGGKTNKTKKVKKSRKSRKSRKI